MRALLIQKSIKLRLGGNQQGIQFESFVNSEEYQTFSANTRQVPWFESFVNSEEYQTDVLMCVVARPFESFVNSEEYQTL